MLRSCSIAEQSRRVLPQHSPFDILAVAERSELIDVLPWRRHSGRRPVRAPEHLVRDVGKARHVAWQRLRRYPRDVEMNIRVTPREKERRLAVQRTPGMREDDF